MTLSSRDIIAICIGGVLGTVAVIIGAEVVVGRWGR